MTKRVVILGAGIGGIAAANELAPLASSGKAEVLLLDRTSTYEFSPSYLWMLSGTRRLADISVPIGRVSRKGIRFEQAEVSAIDPAARVVKADGRVIEADYLVVALGAHTHMGGLDDVARVGHNLYTAAGAEAVHGLRSGRSDAPAVVLVCSMPFKCPAAPYEAAMLWQARLKQQGGASPRLVIYTPEPGPMPVAGEKVSAQMVQMLVRKGIDYHPKHVVKGLTADGKLDFGDSTAPFEHLAYVPKHSVPALLVEAGLAAAGAWVPVDRHTLQTKFPGVYAVGDCVGIPLANGKSLPKAGVFAHGQAEAAGKNIAAEIAGQVPKHRFEGHGQCFVEMGGVMAGRGAGNFYAEPNPDVRLAMPGPWNHLGKVMFEKFWLNKMY
jgi:sulfide:quinone oxidoreductase